MSLMLRFYAFVILVSKCNALYLGDECDLNENGSKGYCEIVTKCVSAMNLLKKRIHPKLCSFLNSTPVVCCASAKNLTQNIGTRKAAVCSKWKIRRITPLIIAGGGEPSLLYEFPHMAALGYDNKNSKINWGCGGSLIDEKYVLTAAHCLYNVEFGHVKYVRIGDLNLKLVNDSANPQDFNVAKTFQHPLYKRPSKYHDIGLIELDNKVDINKDIYPACLNFNKQSPNGEKFIATGWGLLSFQGEAADHLQKLELNLVNNTHCNTFYEINNRMLDKGIVDDYQMCAGFPGRDTCQGDSGGPLQTKDGAGNYEIHGVTSFGRPCLLTKSPGVYTRVANYIQWIESIVWS